MKRARIVIMGRPNVGKSTLFNRLTRTRRALVHDEPGVTRDRIELKTEWWVRGQKLPVLLIDTGGVGGERFAAEIDNQVEIALEDADIVIVVFDARTGVTPQDLALIKRLNRAGIMKRCPLICAVNKVDAEKHESLVADFYSLGFDTVLTLSAEHSRGLDDLQETIAELIPAFVEERQLLNPTEFDKEFNEELDDEEEDTEEESEEDAEGEGSEEDAFEEEMEDEPSEAGLPRIAIVGRPNVGKSTLTNALIGKKRMITSPIAGTTVDAVDSVVEISGKPFVIIDTAGIRRKSKTEQGIEVLSVVQAKKTLQRADIALLLLDGEAGLMEQDEKVGGLIEDAGCGVVLVMNKWDTQRGKDFSQNDAAERIRAKMGYLKYAPIVFMSAKQGKGLENLGDLLQDILEQRKVKIPTKELTEWVKKESTIHNPMNAKFYMSHQSGRHPPTFVCHVSDPDKVHFSLRRHFVNALRDRWGFMGSPVRMLFVKGSSTRRRPRSVPFKVKNKRRINQAKNKSS